jgi:hypothetical protein
MIDLTAHRPGATNQILEEIATSLVVTNGSTFYALWWLASMALVRPLSRTSSEAPSSGSADLSSGHQSTASTIRANSGTDGAEPLPRALT